MTNKVNNALIDRLAGSPPAKSIYRLWGGCRPVPMGDGIRFRVTKSKIVDYVYIRYLGGFDTFEIEFGALVGTEYDVLDRIKPVAVEDLIKTISARVLGLKVVEREPEPEAAFAMAA